MPDYFSKKARRAQEKVLQKLGKADETRDESFDEHVNNFNKQQTEVHKLHKEFKQYLSCLKDMKTAACNLNDAISEVYDGEWGGYSELYSVFEDSKAIWTNLAQRLSEEVVSPFAIYQSQFPDFKSRIAKRGRKLIDYDACRHNLDSVKQKGKADDRKISQLEEEEMVSKKIYEELNSQLSNELPAIYDSRVAFYVSTLHQYYSTEMDFSKKMLKIQEQLCDIVNKVVDGRSASSRSSPNFNSDRRLSADSAGTASVEKSPVRERKKRQAPKVVKKEEKPANPFGDPDKEGDDIGKGNPFGEEKDEGKGNPFGEEEDEGKGNPFGEEKDEGKGNPFGGDDDEDEQEAPGNPFGGAAEEEEEKEEEEEEKQKEDDEGAGNPFGNDDDNNDESKDKDAANPFGNADDKADENDSSKKSRDEPKPASVKSARVSKASKKPDKVLYQVRAKTNYVGNGSDVLSLVKGDYINVIGSDDHRTDKEHEEWLIGIRRSDFVKGSFPASAVAKDTTL